MEEIVLYGSFQPEGLKQMSTGGGTGIVDLVITACDLHTGSHIASFKQTSSPSHGICATQSHIFAAQSQKALLYVYSYLKEGIDQKIVVPERLSCIQVSPCGTWLAAGGLSGRLLIWELCSGRLVFGRDTHYQEITCMEFTRDSAYLFTGSKDARVFGWHMLDLISLASHPEEARPVISWSDHSLAVTSLCIGYGASNEAFVFTGSLDGTVRCWDISRRELHTTFVLSDRVTALAVDPIERAIYAGLANGDIRVVQLYDINPASGYLEAVGGAKRIITVKADSDRTLQKHETAISALVVSFDGNVLVSGDSSGEVLSWDLPSRQVVRKLKSHRGSISSIQIVCRPKDTLVVPSQAKIKGGAGVKQKPLSDHQPIPQLKRTLDPEGQHDHDIWIKIKEVDDTSEPTVSDLLQDVEQAKIHTAQIFGEGTESGLQARVQQLEGDLDVVYKNYSNLRAAHEELWKLHVQS
jgi:pre-rRNA-processing protein IPI3